MPALAAGSTRMIYPIVKFGDPVLEKPSTTITKFDDELRKLADDMFESMYAAHGVGLAAPQIGISKRIAVIDITFKEDPDAQIVLINPEIIHVEGRITSNEGCLSIPEFREKVTRGRKVTARAQNLSGETFEGRRRTRRERTLRFWFMVFRSSARHGLTISESRIANC